MARNFTNTINEARDNIIQYINGRINDVQNTLQISQEDTQTNFNTIRENLTMSIDALNTRLDELVLVANDQGTETQRTNQRIQERHIPKPRKLNKEIMYDFFQGQLDTDRADAVVVCQLVSNGCLQVCQQYRIRGKIGNDEQRLGPNAPTCGQLSSFSSTLSSYARKTSFNV
ncbi:hypothetical protein BDF21DRAFT_399550 [Thamnidium elegans]|nr:hypothetical protein BDF21DRAFT_399550 [Thamnidium elegans]